MPYINARQLKEDVLFRGSEPVTGSSWNDKVIDYLNRVYVQLVVGATEFTPEFIDDWWWHRASGAFNLLVPYKTGTVSVTNGSTAITFSVAPALSMQSRRIRFSNVIDVSGIAAHVAGLTTATLDLPYTGQTNTALAFSAMQNYYDLGASVMSLIGPMQIGVAPFAIDGMSPEAMDDSFPVSQFGEGVPRAFSLATESSVRMSHGFVETPVSTRVEYRYKPTITLLTDATESIPILPEHWRHVLCDMALVYLLADKNDNRAIPMQQQTRLVVASMLKENRRRLAKINNQVAHIKPRLGQGSTAGPLRTNAGAIIG